MARTVADHLLSRLHEWGVRRVHRRARCLHGDFGTGRHPPAQRSLRRPSRSPAGARDRRPAGALGARRRLPAGGRPGLAVQGRRVGLRADGGGAGADSPPRRPRRSDRPRGPDRHLPDPAERPAGDAGRRGTAARARHVAQRHRRDRAQPAAGGRRPRGRGRGAERRSARRSPVRCRRIACDRRADRSGRGARRRRRQGLARQGRVARRPAVCDRLDRPARDPAELGNDESLRHAADGRLQFSVRGVPAEGRPGARRADRHRCAPARAALSDAGQSGRRQPRDLARADTEAALQSRPVLAAAHRARRREVVAGHRQPCRDGGRSPQPSARVPRALAAAARQLHRDRRFRLDRVLVCARPEDPARHDGFAVRRAGDDGFGVAVRDRRKIRASPTGT